MLIAAVVVAAGRGTRFGGTKQFALIDGETVAARSVAACRSVASHVVLVVPEEYDGPGEGADVVVTGGSSRAASVRCGLARCEDADIVIVHDAARPFASPALFEAVVAAIAGGAAAAIPGLALTDTIKRITQKDDVMAVADTLAREELVAVQTPQAFRRDVLERAHERGDDATDDAGLVEAIGAVVVVVPGESTNVKITRPHDLEGLGTRQP
ncbi:MAG TPA: IspD/TarI family cytidylyltransferase [Acidimicrobiales bacterium]|nr:IspD/TarI family cytidylyltransferase [Acidimicrobiales bacterium]